MIYIKKKQEPFELADERSAQINYDNISNDTKRILYEFLLKEQHYLCAYCMRTIISNSQKNHITIDHIKCRNRYPNLSMDYNNMVGACMQCNNNKGSADVYVNPTKEEDISNIKYIFETGEIYSGDEEIQLTLSDILKLNSKILKDSRSSTYKLFIGTLLGIYGNRELTEKEWMAEKKKIIEQEQYPPFVGVLIGYIDEKINLRRREGN